MSQQEFAAKLAEQQRQYGLSQSQLGISQSQLGIQQSAEQRAAQLAPLQMTAAQLANQGTTLDILKKQQEQDAYNRMVAINAAAVEQTRMLNGAPLSPQSSAALKAAVASPQYVPGQSAISANYGQPNTAAINPYLATGSAYNAFYAANPAYSYGASPASTSRNLGLNTGIGNK
jgi:hypothetical protein